MRYSLLILALFGLTAATATAMPTRPNVLVIISDDHGWSDYGFMGHPSISTPALDRLSTQSITFTRGYSPVPLCRPSLATILTGLYPHQHGVTGNDVAISDKSVNAQEARTDPRFAPLYQTVIDNFQSRPNFIRDLTGRGYRAFQTGKWWEGDPIKTAGFTHSMTDGDGAGDRHGGAGLEIGRQGIEPITNFIEQSGTQPWVVWYAPLLPHSPHTPPADLLAKYKRLAPTEPVARYWASVEWFDQTINKLMGYLNRNGLRENTIIIYTTDNGWIQKRDQQDRFAPRSKLSPYEGGVRTPIMISWLGKLTPRIDRENLASNIDLWPTLAAQLNTPLPANLPGINLANETAVGRRNTIYGESFAHDIANVDRPNRSLQSRTIIEGWMKLILPHAPNSHISAPALYDLKADPEEKTNLANQKPNQVTSLKNRLDAWWTPPAFIP